MGLQQPSLQRKRPLETDGDPDTSAEDSDLVKWCVARDQWDTLIRVILAMANAWMQQTRKVHKHLMELHDDIYAMVTEAAMLSSRFQAIQEGHSDPKKTTTFRGRELNIEAVSTPSCSSTHRPIIGD